MMITKFLDPKNNVAFSRIFGTEKNKDILIDFLNDMITFKEKGKVTDVTFLKTVQDPEVAARKTSVVDVLCTDQNGHTYVVEMQIAKEKGFEKRAQYYAAKAYSSQLKVAGKYYTLKEVVFLAITNFVMFPEKKAYKSDHIILDKDSHEHDLKDFSFTFLELPKIDKTLEESTTMVEKWAYFFKHAEETPESEAANLLKKNNVLHRAYEELNRFSWSEEELRAYEQAEKQEADFIAAIDQRYDEGMEKGQQIGMEKGQQIGMEKGQQIGMEKGQQIGMEKGQQIGMEKGRAEGIEEGRAEGANEKQLEIAKKMIQKGMDNKTIAEFTGLSLAEIELIK